MYTCILIYCQTLNRWVCRFFFTPFCVFTFKKHNNIFPRILVNGIQVGRYSVWPKTANQGDTRFLKFRMFAPHKPEKQEGYLKWIFSFSVQFSCNPRTKETHWENYVQDCTDLHTCLWKTKLPVVVLLLHQRTNTDHIV